MKHLHAPSSSTRFIRATAHKVMAFAALRANSSLAVRTSRYDHHMQRARALAVALPATKSPDEILQARLQLIELASNTDMLHHHWSAAFGATQALKDAALITAEHYRAALARIDATAEARNAAFAEVCHG